MIKPIKAIQIVILTLLLVLVASYSYAVNYHLRLVEDLYVLVEDLPKDFNDMGLTKDQIETNAELNVRKAGIPIRSHSSNYLYININGLKLLSSGDIVGYTYNVSVQFKQLALEFGNLMRLKDVGLCKENELSIENICDRVITWETSSIGYTGKYAGNVGRIVQDGIDNHVNKFLNDLLAAKQEQKEYGASKKK